MTHTEYEKRSYRVFARKKKTDERAERNTSRTKNIIIKEEKPGLRSGETRRDGGGSSPIAVGRTREVSEYCMCELGDEPKNKVPDMVLSIPVGTVLKTVSSFDRQAVALLQSMKDMYCMPFVH